MTTDEYEQMGAVDGIISKDDTTSNNIRQPLIKAKSNKTLGPVRIELLKYGGEKVMEI